MAEPTITITPSFGRVLTQDERVVDQIITVKSTLIENTQSVIISFAGFTFTEKMSNNGAIVGIASTFFDNLIDAQTYTITAAVTNIFSQNAEGPFDEYDFTVFPIGTGETGDPVGGGSSLFIQDESVPIGIVTTINFTGTGIEASVTDEIVEVVVNSTTNNIGGGSSMFIEHQDVSLGIVTTLNFTGTGLTVIVSDEIAEIVVDEYDEHFDGGFFTDPQDRPEDEIGDNNFSPGTILIEYEDQPVGVITTLNFIGAGVSALSSNSIGDITIDGDFDGGSY
jgi:hypothetical protein